MNHNQLPFFGPARNFQGFSPHQMQNVGGFLPRFFNQGGPGGFGGAPFLGPPVQPQAGAGWLNQIQGALKAMQSAAPMVKEYGPMMKNLPAMINMMKIMNESDEEVTESSSSSSSDSKSNKKRDHKKRERQPFQRPQEDKKRRDTRQSDRRRPEQHKEKRKTHSETQGTSQPKLYI
ncbi:hypothetical protein GCM10010954_05460 [Halobacillus andaensis]|uniref:YqfQ-like protein n=1 Tax=Halobacillus andaensis TaxID=1176239 RepID=A0A917AY92_HALAA|nr:VrrA/YqfQ family protein [Halobacillus andaensis]MBP2003335.1 hypothetical protein [Halobacillus andaensis]GGF09878.1 hypothetical protein GCM10010954_05460 [Halobacillus andaensis]